MKPAIEEKLTAAMQAEDSGEGESAKSLYEEILFADPYNTCACLNLGTIFFHSRELEKAEILYRRAVEADSDHILAHFNLANVLDERGEYREAIVFYCKTLELAPTYADAHYNLAIVYQLMNRTALALPHWRAYIRLDNQGPWADNARSQIRKLLTREELTIVYRADRFVPKCKGMAALTLVPNRGMKKGRA